MMTNLMTGAWLTGRIVNGSGADQPRTNFMTITVDGSQGGNGNIENFISSAQVDANLNGQGYYQSSTSAAGYDFLLT